MSRHTAAHEKLLKRVVEFECKFHAGDSTFTEEIFQFLVSDWLVKYILGMGRLYAPFLKP
jgi:hemerythrin